MVNLKRHNIESFLALSIAIVALVIALKSPRPTAEPKDTFNAEPSAVAVQGYTTTANINLRKPNYHQTGWNTHLDWNSDTIDGLLQNFQSGGSISPLYVDEFIYHTGDVDTYLQFMPDAFKLYVGGVQQVAGTLPLLSLGSAAADVDVVILGNLKNALTYDWGLGQFQIAVPTTIGDGGTTDYANYSATGQKTMFGGARVVNSIAVDNADLGKGASAASEVIVGNYTAWEFAINDDAVFTFHMPHDWEAGTDLIVNIEWQIDVAAGEEIAWRIVYEATPPNGTEAIGGAGTTVNSGDIVVPGTERFLTQTALIIANADLAADDQVGVTLLRVAIAGGTNPSPQKPGVTDIHIEYTANKLGEAI